MIEFYDYLNELTIKPEVLLVACTTDIAFKIVDMFINRGPIFEHPITMEFIYPPEDKGDDCLPSTTSARETLRKEILKRGYEWSLWLDNDMLVPPDMTETFLKYIKNEPDLLWVHSHHPKRCGNGEILRHGLGSCYIHRDLLENVPFIMCTIRGRNLGDDYLWIIIVRQFEVYRWIKVKHGMLFDVIHFGEDGSMLKCKGKAREELLKNLLTILSE